jgi:hypothetical protein
MTDRDEVRARLAGGAVKDSRFAGCSAGSVAQAVGIGAIKIPMLALENTKL